MADIERLIPHIIKWEAGVTGNGMTAKDLFAKARTKGFVNDPVDRGGATMIGVTLATYKSYCKQKGLKDPDIDALKNIRYEEWKDILKSKYWNRWKADHIKNQSLANLLVDWVWGSGFYAITRPQRLLGVKVDGIVGQKTLSALNGFKDQKELYNMIWSNRKDFYYSIIRNNPSQRKFINGWMNRLNDLRFEK